MKIDRLLRMMVLGAFLAVGNVPQAQAATIPWSGSLEIDFTATGGTSVSWPTLGVGGITINGGSGVLTPITNVALTTMPFGYNTATAESGLGNYGINAPYYGGGVLLASGALSAGGTCGGGFGSFASCPGGGLAGFGPLYLLQHQGVVGPQSINFILGGGGVVTTTAPSLVQYAFGAGWTTGKAYAFQSINLYGTAYDTAGTISATGGIAGTTISLVSPLVIYNENTTSNLYIIEPGIARLTINLTTACGNSLVEPGETCDDGALAPGDGCDASCQVETGYGCTGAPSTCSIVCGDGIILGGEGCDDNNVAPGDGCNASCQIEAGWGCSGEPSVCSFLGTPVAAVKLIVVDRGANGAKAVYVAKDAAITKGTGTSTANIGATLDFDYDNGTDPASAGQFVAASGSANWLVNKSTVAKYVNKTAPTGGGSKVVVIKVGNLVKVVGKNLGDTPIDILNQASVATGTSNTAFCLDNGPDSECFCSTFTGCAWKSIAGGTGAKLVCKSGTGDATCAALP